MENFVKGLILDEETEAALFKIFSDGFNLGVNLKVDVSTLSRSEVQQRIQHRFVALLHELKEQ